MDGYRITRIETALESYSIDSGVRSIEPLVVGLDTVDRAYVVTKHNRSVIWYVYDVIVVRYEKI